jgi:hypothetical protein
MAKRRRVQADTDPLSPDHFRWQVSPAGYRWEDRRFNPLHEFADGGELDGPVLVPQDCSAPREYNPVAVPELFEAFGGCGLGEHSIRWFADRFGLLGVPVWLQDPELADRKVRARLSPSPQGEYIEDWQDEILAMRAAVHIWYSIRAGRAREVQVLFPWGPLASPESAPRSADNIPGDALMVMPDAHRDLESHYHRQVWGAVDRPVPGPRLESAEAAWRLLLRLTNHRLGAHCAPHLVRRGGHDPSFLLRLSPKNLLGAIWWQFARAITGEVTYRHCKVCKRLIELSVDYGFRADREFCSDACKFKDHRAKVRQAKELKAAGRTVRQIAKLLRTKPESVKRWLTKRK